MTSRSRSTLAVMAASTALVLGSALPASAFGGETVGCRISPGTSLSSNNVFYNSKTALGYTVTFSISGSTSDYTYSWELEGEYTSITSGCASTSTSCTVRAQAGVSDVDVIATVTYTQNGQSAPQSAYATILAP